MKTIYLDNNATTRVAPEVIESMTPYFGELYGNPSSAHSFGGEVGIRIREAREKVATVIGADLVFNTTAYGAEEFVSVQTLSGPVAPSTTGTSNRPARKTAMAARLTSGSLEESGIAAPPGQAPTASPTTAQPAAEAAITHTASASLSRNRTRLFSMWG